MDSSSTQAARSVSLISLYILTLYSHQGKKPESASCFFAIHANGIFFFEISRNVFKPPKEIEKFNWRDIKEIQAGQTKIQFLLHIEAGSQRIKIYLDENKSKHVFDIAETYHKQHMARMQSSLSDAGQLPKQGKNEALNDVFRTFCRKVKRWETICHLESDTQLHIVDCEKNEIRLVVGSRIQARA